MLREEILGLDQILLTGDRSLIMDERWTWRKESLRRSTRTSGMLLDPLRASLPHWTVTLRTLVVSQRQVLPTDWTRWPGLVKNLWQMQWNTLLGSPRMSEAPQSWLTRLWDTVLFRRVPSSFLNLQWKNPSGWRWTRTGLFNTSLLRQTLLWIALPCLLMSQYHTTRL